jgi:hypothetical protein
VGVRALSFLHAAEKPGRPGIAVVVMHVLAGDVGAPELAAYRTVAAVRMLMAGAFFQITDKVVADTVAAVGMDMRRGALLFGVGKNACRSLGKSGQAERRRKSGAKAAPYEIVYRVISHFFSLCQGGSQAEFGLHNIFIHGYYKLIKKYNEQHENKIEFGFLYYPIFMINWFKFNYPNCTLNIYYKDVTKDLVEKAHKNGMGVLAWFKMDDEENNNIYKSLFENGVDSIITNYPVEAKKFRDEYFNINLK